MDARVIVALLLLAACNRQSPDSGAAAGDDTPAAGTALTGQVPEAVIVSVNEPFLNATVSDGAIVVRSPDTPEGRHFAISATAASRSANQRAAVGAAAARAAISASKWSTPPAPTACRAHTSPIPAASS